MNKNKRFNFFEIVTLVVGIISLTLGFLAFSTSIIVKTKVDMEPNYEVFRVILSNASKGSTKGYVSGTVIDTGVPGATADTAIISDDSPTKTGYYNTGSSTITGLMAHFTKPGQSVIYRISATNVGNCNAFLKRVDFKRLRNVNSTKSCVARNGTIQSTVDSACKGININIKVGDTLFENNEFIEKSISVNNHSLGIGLSEIIVVNISYAASATEANGPFDIYFGDIVLTYQSID